jgi:hypothetical protein
MVGPSDRVLNPAHWNQYLVSLSPILAAVGHAAFLPVPASVSDVLHPFAVVQFLVHTVTKEGFFSYIHLNIPPSPPCNIKNYLTRLQN